MSTPVLQFPTNFALSGVRTGEPVTSATLSRLADEVGFLSGYNLAKLGEAYTPRRPSGRTVLGGLAFSVHVPFTRHPGTQIVRVAVELHDSNEIGDSQTVTATLPTGASWLDAGGLDGSVTFYNPATGRTAPREIVGWLKVSSVTAGTLTDVVSFTTSPSAKGAGIRRATLHEVPLSTLAVSSSAPGWDASACRAQRPVIDGGASSPRGTQRLFHCLDIARASWRQFLTLSGVESADTTGTGTTPHWSRESATRGEIDWCQRGAYVIDPGPRWYLNVRALYGSTGAASEWKMRARYRTSNATDCSLRIYHRGGSISSGSFTGAAAEGSTDLTLPATSGAWAWSDPVAVSLPVDGTAGLVRIRFEAEGPGAAQLLSLSCIDLRENEA